MIFVDFTIDNSSINAVKAKVELYDGTTLVKTCTCSDALQSFTVDRVGDNNKFFGFVVCQKINLVLIDLDRELSLTKGNQIKVAYVFDDEKSVYPYPPFYIQEITRDEDTNQLNIIGYDKLYAANEHEVSEMEIDLDIPYTAADYAYKVARFLGLRSTIYQNLPAYDITFNTLPNLSGTEKIRAVLNALAEMFQSVCFVNNTERLMFKRLNKDASSADCYITKEDYYILRTGEDITLNAICHATELGDNVIVGDETGITQYLRDNPFLEVYEDISTLLNTMWTKLDGLFINQFYCEWGGNCLLEIGDKIAVFTEDMTQKKAYMLNDSVTYDGTLSQITQWAYEPNENETASNPITLGEKLSQTYAKVDKVNKKIELLVSEADEANEKISNLELTTDTILATVSETTGAIGEVNERVSALEIDSGSISATVKSLQTSTEEAVGAVNENFETLSKQVSTKMSAEDVQISIETEISKGVDKVITSTGFTFNEEGLTVSKSGSEMTTQITEDGMTISRSGQETLVADNTGVKAENLHATTYLIIGSTSRFEDYGIDRTGCFWIGG